MTTPQEQFTDVARRGQEAVSTAMQTWADNMQKLAGTFPAGDASVPNVDAVVDNYFTFAEQMLRNQRDLTKSLLAAATPEATKANGTKKS